VGATLTAGKTASKYSSCIWSSTKDKSSIQNAFEHWKCHKNDFPELHNSREYVQSAKDFYKRGGVLEKTRQNGDRILYDPNKNLFGVYNKDGVPRTFYRPDPRIHGMESNLEYFHAQ
jgi:pyocin large subunit-like protein